MENTTPDLNNFAGQYVGFEYGEWDSSGHECGDIDPAHNDCVQPVMHRTVTAVYMDRRVPLGTELEPHSAHVGRRWEEDEPNADVEEITRLQARAREEAADLARQLDTSTILPTPTTPHQKAADALAHLYREDAPPIQWAISEDGSYLSGHVLLFDADDTTRRRTLSAWQRVIGAGPVTSEPMAGREQLSITGSYQGVRVKVFTSVDPTPVCCDQCQGHEKAA